MAVEVKIPDPARQYEKTPARRVKVEQVEDPETGETQTVKRWVTWMEGKGDSATIVKLDELIGRVPVQAAPLVSWMDLYQQASGEPYVGTSSAKAVCAALLDLYGEPAKDYDGVTLTVLKARLVTVLKRLGRWGLGCPHACGRFWEFKPTENFSGLDPSDPVASQGVDEEGSPTNGYLNWRPQPDGSTLFACDRCGGEVKLA